MSLTQHDINWDSSSGAGTSFTLTTFMDRADGPYAVLFFAAARGQNVPIVGRLTPPQGNFKLVGRKYKSELSATLELWAGWGLAGTSAAGTLSFQMDYDASYSGVACSVLALTGSEQGDNFVSSPVWSYTLDGTRQQHKTPLKSSVCRNAEDSPQIAQYVFHVREGSQTLTRANAAQDYADNLFLGAISIVGMHNGTTDIATQTLAPEYIETVVSSSAALSVSVNVHAPLVFDGKEGTSLQDNYTPEEEMRLKERITELERDLTATREQQATDQADFVESNRKLAAERDSHKTHAETSRAAVEQALAENSRILKQNTALQQQLDAVPQLLAERDDTIAQMSSALANYEQQFAAVQQELDATRSELQQTLAALPAHIEQAATQIAQQQIAQLLSDPAALRELLMQHAQAAQQPRDLFGALQSLSQLG